ncbi:unnamed protein product [Staurois parvus]|uniref:Uncharacterized protein n=1 Tax=Staurois parvus TaxID=386267 RepID=A0ABN9ECX6_9NEOB|nr:unnamed protein product [Staurois parvus]
MGPPTDPGPSGSTRVSKWSVRPWLIGFCAELHQISRSLVFCKSSPVFLLCWLVVTSFAQTDCITNYYKAVINKM